MSEDPDLANIISGESAKTAPQRELFREETYPVTGAWCTNNKCRGEDGQHTGDCPKQN